MPEVFTILAAKALVLPARDIDTDQIIPARFLTTTSATGLGAHLFQDVRGEAGLAAALADPRAGDCRVLVAGDNFGCGSSREHAPWALLEFGFRAVVSTSFADIFRGNAIKNGLLPVQVEPDVHRALLAAPWTEVTIDLRAQTISGAGAEGSFTIDGFSKNCLLQGIDSLNFLCSHAEAIAAFEERHP